MLPEHPNKATKRRGPTRYPGIVKAASALGVSRIHLWYVLTSQRQSPKLQQRYAALKRDAA